ncbi:MAG: Gfo/Idh/MocA family oxidoreductase [Hyphomicrobiales bacterium]|nr:Gfo/Idh/MocA family oxidoreductase [Hyphomicrobiales bacterium]
MARIGWGLIGGGEGSQIGFAHRASAGIDGRFEFLAGALDADPGRARQFGLSLGLKPERAYGDWRQMLAGEEAREDRIEFVTVATPNVTHFEISKAFLESGFHVLCEKPMTMTVEEARALVEIAEKSQRICAVNYGYSGYPLVRQMKAMVASGQLGRIRVAFAEFAGGFMADSADADNPRVRWRFDRAQAGVSAITMDAGIHALHLACYVTGRKVTSVSSDFAHGIAGRELEDDSLTAFRMEDGVIGRAWASGLAIGRTHGLTLQVFGETGGLRWAQEQPNQLFWTPLNEPTRVLERGASGLSDAAERASRITVGHAEGMPLAFANIYRDLGEVIASRQAGAEPDPLALDYPTAEDGLHSIEIIHAMAESAGNGSRWTNVP